MERPKEYRPLTAFKGTPQASPPAGVALRHSTSGPAVGTKLTLRFDLWEEDKDDPPPHLALVGPVGRVEGTLIGYTPDGFVFTIDDAPECAWIAPYDYPRADLFEFKD